MNKDIKVIFENYKKILENSDISNNMSSDVSTKFTTDHMARFLPIGQDDEEKKKRDPLKELRNKLNNFFTSLKAFASTCQAEGCKSSDIGKLIDLMDNPEARTDLEELKKAIQLMDQDNGNNSKLSSF
jgi:hypothetical protein